MLPLDPYGKLPFLPRIQSIILLTLSKYNSCTMHDYCGETELLQLRFNSKTDTLLYS